MESAEEKTDSTTASDKPLQVEAVDEEVFVEQAVQRARRRALDAVREELGEARKRYRGALESADAHRQGAEELVAVAEASGGRKWGRVRQLGRKVAALERVEASVASRPLEEVDGEARDGISSIPDTAAPTMPKSSSPDDAAACDVLIDAELRMPGTTYRRLFDYQFDAVRWLWQLHCQRTHRVPGGAALLRPTGRTDAHRHPGHRVGAVVPRAARLVAAGDTARIPRHPGQCQRAPISTPPRWCRPGVAHQLRAAAAASRPSSTRALGLRHPRRGPPHPQRRRRHHPRVQTAAQRAPHHPQRRAAAEPPARAVEPVRLCVSRTAGHAAGVRGAVLHSHLHGRVCQRHSGAGAVGVSLCGGAEGPHRAVFIAPPEEGCERATAAQTRPGAVLLADVGSARAVPRLSGRAGHGAGVEWRREPVADHHHAAQNVQPSRAAECGRAGASATLQYDKFITVIILRRAARQNARAGAAAARAARRRPPGAALLADALDAERVGAFGGARAPGARVQPQRGDAAVSVDHAGGRAGAEPHRRRSGGDLRPRLEPERGLAGAGARLAHRATAAGGGVPAGDARHHRGEDLPPTDLQVLSLGEGVA
eukprot:ctg_2510.g346